MFSEVVREWSASRLFARLSVIRHTVAAPGIYLVITEKRAAKVVVK